MKVFEILCIITVIHKAKNETCVQKFTIANAIVLTFVIYDDESLIVHFECYAIYDKAQISFLPWQYLLINMHINNNYMHFK